jgi:hypothetical protein
MKNLEVDIDSLTDDEQIHIISDSTDIERIEMKWNINLEKKLQEWMELCKDISIAHSVMAKKRKQCYYTMSIPSILIPLFMGFTQQYFGEEHEYYPLISSSGYLITGTLTALNTFLGYGAKYVEHEVASNRYEEIMYEIDSILIKPKKHRQAADVCMERIKNNIESLNKFSVQI